MWPLWGLIKIPVMAVRGAKSDLLLEETFAQMKAANAKGYVVEEAGHAPALMDSESIAAIREFLLQG